MQRTFDPASGGLYDVEYRTVGLRDGAVARLIRATGGLSSMKVAGRSALSARCKTSPSASGPSASGRPWPSSCALSFPFRHALPGQSRVHFFHEQSGCEAVGIRLKEGGDYPYFEARGFPEEFIQAENSLCIRDPDGQVQRDHAGSPVMACMCGNVICGRFDPEVLLHPRRQFLDQRHHAAPGRHHRCRPAEPHPQPLQRRGLRIGGPDRAAQRRAAPGAASTQ